jgi:hypothetical protein
MVIGMADGRTSVGTVAATCRRSGVTGSVNPVSRMTPAAQAPSALTTAPHVMRSGASSHRGHSVSGPELESARLHTPADPRAQSFGRAEVARKQIEGAEKPIGGAPGAAQEALARDRRIELTDIVGCHGGGFAEAGLVLHAPGIGEGGQLACGPGEPEVAVRRVAGVHPGVFLERLEPGSGEERQADVDRGGILRSEPAGCAGGASGARRAGAIE